MKTMMFILLLMVSLTIDVDAQDEIIWAHFDFPPYEFTAEKYDGEGYCGAAKYEAIKYLSGYKHIIQEMQWARFLKLLKNKPNYCVSCLFKTPAREEFMWFSKPYEYSESIMLVSRSADEALYQPYVDTDGMINLETLLNSDKIILSVVHERSYGALIDSIVEPFRDTNRITTLSSSISIQLMLRRLITLKAYHAVLGYPTEFGWHATQLKIAQEQFKVYPIKGLDAFDPISYTYFGCSKTETGKEVIDIIDANIHEIRQTAFPKHRQWLDSDSRMLHELHESEFIKTNP